LADHFGEGIRGTDPNEGQEQQEAINFLIDVINHSQTRLNPQLLVSTPLLVRWRINDQPYFSNSVFKVNWSVQPVAELGAKVKEVVRYKHEGSEYLAIKLLLLNHSTQTLDVTMSVQP
jgi:hypothetical protein